MSNGFVHSAKVPRLYKTAATIVRSVREDGGSLKTLIYQKKHPNVSGIYALTFTTLQKSTQLDYLIRKTRILFNEPRLDPWLARVLITELIWGKKCLKADCKPVQTVLGYKKQLWEELKNMDEPEAPEECEKAVQKPRYVRINTLMLPVDRAISYFEKEGWFFLPRCSTYSMHIDTLKTLVQPNFIQDYHVPEMLVFPGNVSFHNHLSYLNGNIILQDKASCLPVHILNPEKGSVILDMCAAPGMKTTHLAARINNQGTIYAVELDQRRYKTLCEQIEKTDSLCVKPLHFDALAVSENECPNIDYILVDPSCSGSGMTDRKVLDKDINRNNPSRLKSLQAFQVFVLRHALLSFPTAKRVVYSTCSINAEENEQVIDEILEDISGAYKLVPAKEFVGDGWINYSSKDYNCSDNCLYARTENDLCNGFFVAVFERNFDVNLPLPKRKFEQIVQEITTNENPSSRKRKKRGKKKHKIEDVRDYPQVEDESAKEAQEEILHEEPGKKKKKKKNAAEEVPKNEETFSKVFSEEQSQEDSKQTASINLPEEERQKKKKKKRKKEAGNV